MQKKKRALITGASRGIGLELAALFAQARNDLVLVARSLKDLITIKRVFEERAGISVHIVAKDLSLPGAAEEVYKEVKEQGLNIDYLVNNAGFGDFVPFAEAQWEKLQDMINLNVSALTHFSHLFIKEWTANSSPGKILYVASTAAFQPGPMMAVYFATKAYVLHFSEALREELKSCNISITALCPGPTATHFGEVSNMKASDVVKNVKISDAKEVAKMGYRGMMKNKSIVIPGTVNKIIAYSVGLLPRDLVSYLSGKIMQPQSRKQV